MKKHEKVSDEDEKQIRLLKVAIKEVAEEWLDKRARQLGKWAFSTIMGAITVLILKWFLHSEGWYQK